MLREELSLEEGIKESIRELRHIYMNLEKQTPLLKKEVQPILSEFKI